MRIPVEDVDDADLLIHLPIACRFIDNALRSQGVVLVHCVQGLSRSAAVIAAYCTFNVLFFSRESNDDVDSL
jgi:dual specificity phosphatase 12